MSATASLKDTTKELHHHLDHLPMMQELLSKNLTEASYATTLYALACWYNTLEEAFSGQWHAIDWQPKTPLILTDLNAVDPINELKLLPLNTPVNTSNAFALGVFYVCEGATMGGQIIGPRVSQRLGRNDLINFYQCYGSSCFSHWQITKTFLDEQLFRQQDIEDAVRGARWAFTSLIDWIEELQDQQKMLQYA